MNRDELEEMLAEHLGGELPPEKAALFEEAMASDPDLRAEAESLKRTLGAFGALGAAPARRRAVWPAALRYAAAAAVAFAAGWLLRGAPAARSAPGPQVPLASVPVDSQEWRVRFAQNYLEQPGGSGLARSLVALSRASQ